jgi:hypothetical protein
MAQSYIFFFWIGNNDVLGYATSGGDGTNPITTEALFTQAYTALVTTLTSAGAKGVVANIPDVTGIPFLQQFLTIHSIRSSISNCFKCTGFWATKTNTYCLGQGSRLIIRFGK